MTAKRTFVTVQVTFDGIHNWENAPNFLRHPHQHQFKVGLKVETIPGDNSRSIEFFELKETLRKAIGRAFPEVDSLKIRQVGGLSTEAISDRIHAELPVAIAKQHLWIEVNEDETQGSESEYVPEPAGPEAAESVLITEEEIQRRVAELGQQITEDYADMPDVVVLCLLKGAFMFVADLVREIRHPGLEVEFLQIASYHGKERGEIRVLGALPKLRGRHVLLVDDILDSGKTLRRAVELVEAAGAASIRTAVLLARTAEGSRSAEYCGFVLECDDFVSGYGMDVDGKHRQVRHLRAAS